VFICSIIVSIIVIHVTYMLLNLFYAVCLYVYMSIGAFGRSAKRGVERGTGTGTGTGASANQVCIYLCVYVCIYLCVYVGSYVVIKPTISIPYTIYHIPYTINLY
jgi:hypothetical protein